MLQNLSETHHAWTELFRGHSVLLGKRERQIQILLTFTFNFSTLLKHLPLYPVFYSKNPCTGRFYAVLTDMLPILHPEISHEMHLQHFTFTPNTTYRSTWSTPTTDIQSLRHLSKNHTYDCVVREIGYSRRLRRSKRIPQNPSEQGRLCC